MLKYISFYNNLFRNYLFLILFFNIGCIIFIIYNKVFIKFKNYFNCEINYIKIFNKINKIINNINLLNNQININKNKIEKYSEKFDIHKKKLKSILSTNKNSQIYIKYKIIINSLKNNGIKNNKLNKILLHLLTINCDN